MQYIIQNFVIFWRGLVMEKGGIFYSHSIFYGYLVYFGANRCIFRSSGIFSPALVCRYFYIYLVYFGANR
jgi:hypothetical protein